MIIYFYNCQDKLDPNHGRAISSEDDLNKLLDHARNATPFTGEFCGAGDFEIMIGIGGDFSCVQSCGREAAISDGCLPPSGNEARLH